MDEIRNSKLFRMDTDDPDEFAALFDNILGFLLNRHAPVKHKNTTNRSCVPWMNDEIKLINDRGKLKGNGELLKHTSIYCLTGL